jgi:hypothetical protein
VGKGRLHVKVDGVDFVHQVKWGPYSLPRRYRASFDEPERPYTFEIDVTVSRSGFECREVTFTARPGEALQGSELRVPIAGMIRHSAPVMAMREAPEQPGKWVQVWGEEELEAFYAAFRSYERKGGREPITASRLREVARIYKANERSGAPSKAVAAALDLSDSYARALVARARAAGVLPPARKKETKR